MALIKCYECGKEISDKALACPKCGCPVESIVNDRKDSQERDFDIANFHQDRGIQRLESGDNQGALSDFNKVISIDPNHAFIHETYLNLGAAQARLGNPAKALISTNKALEIKPRYKEALNNKALLIKGIKTEKLWKGISKVILVPLGVIIFYMAKIGLRVLLRNLFS